MPQVDGTNLATTQTLAAEYAAWMRKDLRIPEELDVLQVDAWGYIRRRAYYALRNHYSQFGPSMLTALLAASKRLHELETCGSPSNNKAAILTVDSAVYEAQRVDLTQSIENVF